MKIIRLEPNPSGGYTPVQDWSGDTAPEGYATIPDGFDLATYYATSGFVTLTVVDDVVTAMTANQAAKDANDAAYPAVEPTEQISEEDTTLDMMADHEYRLCMLELGAV